MSHSIPNLPGELVPRGSEQELWLKARVAALCKLDERFPGSQPVSFGSSDLLKLESKDFWVAEKSDGVRVLLYVATVSPSNQSVYLLDRHNSYRELKGLFFPHHENPVIALGDTLVDGELVLDVDPRTRRETLRFLAFDSLAVNGQNVMSRTLDKRYGRLVEFFYKPFAKMTRDHPHVVHDQPFEIKIKEIRFSYRVEDVFNIDIPALQHGNDGLIYTCVSTPYIPGTDKNILKWKPPSENSIDFKLVLRFPPSETRPREPDLYSKPVFVLQAWAGGEGADARYQSYDLLFVDDDEWETLKESGEQVDDRIVEVRWESANACWRLMRFRDDKPHGNHRSVVDNIVESIADGVEKEALLARSVTIRNAWKARQPPPHPPPPPQHHPHGSGGPHLDISHPRSSAPYPQPPPPPQQQHPHPHQQAHQLKPAPPAPGGSFGAEIRYGPIASAAPWSKVGGPPVVAGLKR